MREPLRTLIEGYFSIAKSELLIGGVPVGAIVEKYPTPLFIYSAEVLARKWNSLRGVLPKQFSICYSVKANPNPALVRQFVHKGCGLEIASGGEFRIALESGCPPEKILFAGPGKTEEELKLVLTKGIGEIHIESALETERLSRLSASLGLRARVAVRINPGAEAQGGAMRMGGKPAPFGLDEEKLDDVLPALLGEEFIEFTGLHFYLGTQILDYAVLAHQYREVLKIAVRISERIGRPLGTVDFGGGLGIPYFAGEQALDVQKFGDELHSIVGELCSNPAFVGARFIVEPGRYLVGEAGVYVARVNDIKISRGKKFLIVDGGMNHHLAASGNLGQVIKRNFPIALLNKMTKAPVERVDIVGPLCTPLDVLAREVDLPVAEIGDLVGVFQSGAYARTASPLGFLSYPAPPEVLIENGQPRLIRRRGNDDDLLKDIPAVAP